MSIDPRSPSMAIVTSGSATQLTFGRARSVLPTSGGMAFVEGPVEAAAAPSNVHVAARLERQEILRTVLSETVSTCPRSTSEIAACEPPDASCQVRLAPAAAPAQAHG